MYLKLRLYCEKATVGYKDFQIFRVLGKGAFGAVHAVKKLDTKKIYAMKEMEKKRIKFYSSEKMCKLEKQALQSITSPFALNLKYSFSNSESLFLVMDICQGGDLQFHLSETPFNRFNLEQTRFYAAELLLALEHIHSLDFVYRDLKPGNILLDESGHVMLSDLGLAAKLSSKKPVCGLAGTAGYWAPEVLMRKPQTKAIDWWSFGILLVRLLSGKRPKCCCTKKGQEWCPFGTSDDHPKMAKAGLPMKFSLDLDSCLQDEMRGAASNINSVLSEEAKDLIIRLLEPDPSKRLGANGADEIRHHKFFQGIDWDLLAHKDIKPPFTPSKGEIHAVSLAEIADADPNLGKYRKLEFDKDDEEFYQKWDYKSITALQEEIVRTLKRNENLKKKAKERIEKKLLENNLNRGCCTLQ
jgi:serine/threonine protein kinase